MFLKMKIFKTHRVGSLWILHTIIFKNKRPEMNYVVSVINKLL